MDHAVELAVAAHKKFKNAEKIVETRKEQLDRTLYHLQLNDEQFAEYVRRTNED